MLQTIKKSTYWILQLDRPTVYNALNPALIHAIKEVAEESKAHDSVRALILTGSGKAFSSGADLKEGISEPNLGNILRKTYNPMIETLRGLEIPVIGAINGIAAGAGCSLALACDYLVAKEDAYFTELFVQIGLTLDAGSTAFLMQTVGYHKAFEIASSGRKISAEEAKQLGWVAEIIKESDWERRLEEIGEEWSNKPTRAIGLMKKGLQSAFTMPLKEVLELEAENQTIAGQTYDFSEGVMSFLQKRKSEFKGR